MTKLATEVAANCKTCSGAKYNRYPKKQMLGETPIPIFVEERLHVDVFSTDQKYFLIHSSNIETNITERLQKSQLKKMTL